MMDRGISVLFRLMSLTWVTIGEEEDIANYVEISEEDLGDACFEIEQGSLDLQ